MKLYLSGPMTGYPDFNGKAFFRARQRLRAMAHAVRCPAEFSEKLIPDPDLRAASRRLLMCADLMYITTEAEGLIALPGWPDSAGAVAEIAAALSVGLPCWSFDAFTKTGLATPVIKLEVT